MTMTTSESRPEKIAILGGGMGSIAAAFELVESGKPYDITIYQLGWRLGGKGASGRNMEPAYHHRIEEHGLHIWTGLYDNAFRIMRECYEQLGRTPDAPLATWRDAFKPKNFLVLNEVYKGQWHNWEFKLPTNNQLPGEPDATLFLPLWCYVGEAIQLMQRLFKQSPQAEVIEEHSSDQLAGLDWRLRQLVKQLTHKTKRTLSNFGHLLLFCLAQLADNLCKDGKRINIEPYKLKVGFGGRVTGWLEKSILKLLAAFMQWLWDHVKHNLDDAKTRKYWICLNFAYGNLRGMLEDQIIRRGFDVVDDKDYREWLQAYLFDDTVEGQSLTINSPLAWFLYDADFAYLDGDLNQPNLSASIALYTLVRLAFTWKGSVIWEMQAGMGDTVFTPFYQVLRRRGVKFEFFHRVKQLHLSDDKTHIAAITVGKQAHLKPKQEQEQEYQPFVRVKGLDCWPSTPLYEQLQDGERLKRENINLEASYCKEEVEEIRLEAGQDFDKVVLGISLGALPYLCHELIETDSKWKKMVEKVKTVRTQAVQLWLKPTAYQLGWQLMGQPILDVHHETSLTTWADLTHLLEREGWSAEGEHYPLNLAYLVGPMKDDPDEPAISISDPASKEDDEALWQERANQQVKEVAIRHLEEYIGNYWPDSQSTATPKRARQGFKWELLVDDRAGEHEGVARLDSQYIRANVEPSERYVMSVSGSTRYRLKPDESGFDNLYLAGDWTNNGFNAGCIEAATMSGMLVSNAISGYPARDKIVGLTFGHGMG